MKICLYSPYIPKHFGGGEKYLLDCAAVLSQEHQVFVAVSGVDARQSKQAYQQYFGIDLSRVTFISSPLGTSANFIQKLWWTRQWDVLYYLTDGSLFFSLASQNILHIQVPLSLNKSSWWEQLKLSNWQIKNTNSYFTKEVVEKKWPTKIDVVHWPLIETAAAPSTPTEGKKEKIILNVGRFFRQLHSKRQDILVEVFRQLVTQNKELTKGWKLVLIGAVEDKDYFDQIKVQAADLPVEFQTDLDRVALESWYQRASIYWHATGYQVDETLHPEKVEHFGISTAEAMSYGCVPVVINKGGQKEILADELSHLLWETKAECIKKTLSVMTDKKVLAQESQRARQRAEIFGRDRFESQLAAMVGAVSESKPSKPTQPGKVSAVIPTYNGLHLLQKNLPAVVASLRTGDELVIVDDASSDGTVSWLKEEFKPQKRITVTILSNPKNLRFAGAVNRGVAAARGEFIFLLNNDVRPQADVLAHLLPAFENENVFAVGCMEIEKQADGSVIKGGKNKLWFQRGMFIHSRADNFTSGATAWVSGGSGLFDRQKWLALGGFDSLFYPAYWEDIDLSIRARHKGWQVLFEEMAVVEHVHETTNETVFGQKKIDAMSWKNARKFVWKNGNWWQRVQYLLWQPYWWLKRKA
ncbi:MAG TPA: glycosyltransferase [Patescibacteria group bacterium]